jgi:hypothetical protein
VFVFASCSFEWRIAYPDRHRHLPIPLIPIRLSTFARCTLLTTGWDNGFCVARAWAGCCGKFGLNVMATECTIVGMRTVVCALHAMPTKQIVALTGCVRTGCCRARQELLRQIAVPIGESI